jgi:hypothetical protein
MTISTSEWMKKRLSPNKVNTRSPARGFNQGFVGVEMFLYHIVDAVVTLVPVAVIAGAWLIIAIAPGL